MKRAVVYICFDRPQYVKRVVPYVQALEGLDTWDLWTCQDGPYDAACALRVEEVNSLIAPLDGKAYGAVRHKKNRGVGTVHISLREKLFDHYQYDYVVFIEEDILVSPVTLKIAELLQELRPNDIVGFFAKCRATPQEKKNWLGQMIKGSGTFMTVIPKSAWDKVKEIQFNYLHKFLIPHLDQPRPYRCRDNQAIVNWFSSLVGRDLGVFPSSQDACAVISCEVAGVNLVSTRVNHVVTIGEQGEHYTPAGFLRHNHNEINLDCFPWSEVEPALRSWHAQPNHI